LFGRLVVVRWNMPERSIMSDLSRAEIASSTTAKDPSAVSWAAVIAGGVTAAALTLSLVAFGAGMGFSAVSPWPGSGISATTFKIATGIYLIVVAMLSSTIGGYIAGRLRTKWTGLHGEEVLFRDTAHGFLAWATATVFGAVALASAATIIAGGATAGAAQGAGQAAAQSAGTGAPNPYFVDALLRPQPGSPAGGPAGQADPAAIRGEITRILARGLGEGGELPAADRAYLAQVVAARTGMSQPDAEKRVSEVIEQARSAADAARRAAAKLSLWLAGAMLIGAFSASLAAIEGGQLRDGTWKGVIGTSRYQAQRVR
jgi:hypothetical protein